MRKQLVMLFVGATIAVGCGEVTTTETPRSYLITTDSAASVNRLAMTTAALVGRHSVIPKGADSNPDNARKCPISGEENKIVITPACAPDADFTNAAVDCTFTEVYTCPEVSGTIVNTVHMGTDSLDFKLEMDGYQEGNDELGFIKYTGSVSASTKPDGTITYSSTIAVVARGLGATQDTIADSASEVSIATSATSIAFNGSSNLNTPLGKATMVFNNVDFGDCAVSPKTGSIDMALVGLERAQLRIDGCGDVKLVHFVGDVAGDEEKMTEAQLASAFGSSVSDVVTFKGAFTNTEPASESIISTWCVPLSANVPAISAVVPENIYIPGNEFFDPTTITTGNPMIECLEFSVGTAAPVEGVTIIQHSVTEDLTGLGLFGDPTQNLVHFLSVVTTTTDSTTGVMDFDYFRKLSGSVRTEAEIGAEMIADDTGAGTFTNLCSPATHTGGAGPCPNLDFNFRIDHFGVFLLDGALETPPGYYFVRTYVGE